MRFTHLEKTILLSLKARWVEAVAAGSANGVRKEPVAAGSAEELWKVIDHAYRYWNTVKQVEGGELIKERILDVTRCSEDDMRVTLNTLCKEKLVRFSNDAYEAGAIKHPEDRHAWALTSDGLRVCREFEDEV